MSSILILGRQPELGAAEIESLFAENTITMIADDCLFIDRPHQTIPFQRLGGSIKLAKLLSIIESDKWEKVEEFGLNNIPNHLDKLPPGKFRLGVSAYGFNVSGKQVLATGLKFKSLIKKSGQSVRLVPNQLPALNSAQVLHNKLTRKGAWELLFIKSHAVIYVAQTMIVQDINAYAARDQSRPKRDAKVGMLPPKLAQIIINLATGPMDFSEVACQDDPPKLHKTILDPFCGTGVILQEGQKSGYDVIGTDIENRMINYSKFNIEWFQKKFHPVGSSWRIEIADATTFEWRYPFDMIASETYLGRPFSAWPKPSVLKQIIKDVNYIHKKFLLNVTRQTKPGFRMCLAVPVWIEKTASGKKCHTLPILENISNLGYTEVKFRTSGNRKLIYHRPDQIVGRQLIILIRK